MPLKNYWFSHRYTDESPEVQAKNLRRAHERLLYLRREFRARGIVLSAPWLDWAEAGIPESEAWRRIETMLPWHDGIALDLSDGKLASTGMLREEDLMLTLGRPVEVVR